MNNRPLENWDELFGELPVDDAVRDEHRDRLKVDVLNAYDLSTSPEPRRRRLHDIGRFLMKYKAPHWTVAAVTVACLVWLTQNGSIPAFAVEEVVSNMADAKTARFEMIVKVAGQPEMKMKGFYLEPAHFRQEMVGGYINISDWKIGKMVGFDPKNKRATVISIVNMPKTPDGKRQQNHFEAIRDSLQKAVADPDTKVEMLGEKQLDGRTVVGFRFMNGPMPTTMWADPKTKYPIRIESTMIGPPKTEVVMSNYEFNVELDESLFSTKIPDGYKVTKANVDASKPREQDFITALRLCGKATGKFPTGFDTAAIAFYVGGYLAKQGVEKDGKGPTGKQLEEVAKISRGFQFAMLLPPETDAHYAGGKAEHGNAMQPVLWYRPENSKKYRVIYADLSVKELDIAPQVDGAKKLARDVLDD